MTKLKGKDEKAYTGCEKGGVFAVYNDKKENVGNFADEAAAVQLGGYEIVGKDKSEPPEGVKNDSSAKVESGKAAAASPQAGASANGTTGPGGGESANGSTGPEDKTGADTPPAVDPKTESKTDTPPAKTPA